MTTGRINQVSSVKYDDDSRRLSHRTTIFDDDGRVAVQSRAAPLANRRDGKPETWTRGACSCEASLRADFFRTWVSCFAFSVFSLLSSCSRAISAATTAFGRGESRKRREETQRSSNRRHHRQQRRRHRQRDDDGGGGCDDEGDDGGRHATERPPLYAIASVRNRTSPIRAPSRELKQDVRCKYRSLT